MGAPDGGGNGFTNKELLLHIWEELRNLRTDFGNRLDTLEAARDRGYGFRKVGWVFVVALMGLLMGAIGSKLGIR